MIKALRSWNWIAVVVLAICSFAHGQISYPAANDINVIAGTGTMGYNGTGGSATSTDLYEPLSAVFDLSGNVWIDDGALCLVLEVPAASGDINSIFGTVPSGGYYYDCVPTYGVTYDPMGAAVDASGNMYFIDGGTYIRKRTSSGSLSVVAGVGAEGHTGDGGAATSAEISASKLAIDSSGNIFFVQSQYTSTRVGEVCSFNTIREVATSGLISTVAGNGTCGYTGDGGAATSAEIEAGGLAVDSSDNIYITNLVGCALRKVTASNQYISTIAGNGTCGYSGDGGAAVSAELKSPTGVTVDSSGNVYVADYGNYRIRMISPSTQDISTIAGDGTLGCSGNGGAATSAELGYLGTLAIDGSGHLIFTDTDCANVRAVTLVKPTPSISLSCSPNPITYGGETTECTVDVGNGATGTTTWTINGGAWTAQTLSGGTASAGGFNGYASGSYTISVAYNGDSNNNTASTSTTLTITKATPTVSVSCSPSPLTYGSGNSICTAYASDSGTVTGTIAFTINGAAWATETLSSDSAAAPQFSSTYGIGTFTVGASYSGDGNNNAVSASTTLTISKATPSVSVSCSPNPVAYAPSGTGNLTTCTATVNAPGSAANVVFTYNGNTWTTQALNNMTASASGFTPSTAAQSFTIVASYAGDANYNAANASATFTISQASQTIAFTAPASPVTYGASPISLSASASSGLGVTFSVVSGPGSVSGNTLTITGAGTVVVAANQAGNGNYTAAAQVTQSVVVNKATPSASLSCAPSPVIYVPSGSGTLTTCTAAVNAPGSVASVAFTYNGTSWTTQALSNMSASASGFNPGTAAQTFTIAANYAGDSNYNAASASTAFTISQASQTISFTAPSSPVTYGVSPISLSASASSALGVTFSVVSGPGSVSGSTLTITGAGTVVVAANQAGNTNYAAAPQIEHSVVVSQASQRISFPAPSSPVAYGVSPITLAASSSSGLAVTFSVVSGPGSLSGSTLTFTGVGTVVVAANQTGNTNYAAAAQVTQSVVVNQESQTISFTAPLSPVTYGVSPISLSASASSGLSVTLSVLSGPGSISDGTLTITGAGTILIGANQSGNTNYSAATQITHSITVNQAILTVTAINASKAYGTANSTFSSSYAGFVNGDTSAVLSGAPSLTTTATASSPVGSYQIIAAAGTLSASNYSFLYVSGTLTVTQAVLTVTANNASRAYGTANPVFTPSYSGFMNGDTSLVLSGSPSLTTVATASSPVGTYTIAAASGSLTAANYTFVIINGTLTVSQAVLTVMANNASRPYGAANSAFAVSYSGFINGDTAAVLSGSPSVSTTATLSSPVGTYTITAAPGSLAAANYSFIFVSGILTISKAMAVITVNSSLDPSIYGDQVLFTYTATGVDGVAPQGQIAVTDGSTSLGTATLNANGQAVLSISSLAAGSHTINAAYSGDGNYY